MINDNIEAITEKVETLLLRRSEVTSELSNVDKEIAEIIQDRNLIAWQLNFSVVKDSTGVPIIKGDYIETVTKGK